MKKMFFMAAVAALALSSCSSDELVQGEQPVVEDGAVVFSANTLRNTRATADVISGVADLANKGGFGVFAYEQGKAGFNTYSANSSYPNFMYNQNVWGCQSGNDIKYTSFAAAPDHWAYSPIKYYSNNEGAKHSFFAYAPYMPSLQPVFALGHAPAIRYAVGTDEYDLMWAPAIIDQEKPGVKEKLTFNFQHALSKVSIYVAPFVDDVHGASHSSSAPENKLDQYTEIRVRSVKFVGTVASQGLLNLENGKWTYEATDDAAYELDKDIQLKNHWTEWTDESDNHYENVTKDMMVIPTLNGKKLAIEIVYDVITTDDKHAVNSTITTNTITSEKEFSFEAGKAYTFLLDLGMTSVKFDAKVGTWGGMNSSNVDLPNNHHYTLISAPKLAVAKLTEGTDLTKLTQNVGEIVMANDLVAYEVTKKYISTPSEALGEVRRVSYQYIIDDKASTHHVYVYDASTKKYVEKEASSLSGNIEAVSQTAEDQYFYDSKGYYLVPKTTVTP